MWLRDRVPTVEFFQGLPVTRMFKSVALCVVFGFSGILFAGDWPGFRGPAGNGIVSDVRIPDKLALAPMWRIPIGEGFGQFVVEGDRAVVFTKRGDDEFAVCFDVKTGKEIWATRVDRTTREKNYQGPRTTPAISGDRVYIYSTYVVLTCLDLASGKEVWRKNIAREYGGKVIVYCNAASPIIVDDLVVVTGGGPGKGILAFGKTTGQLAWATCDSKFTHTTPVAATILGTKQVICFMQSGLVSVDARSGRILWTVEQRYPNSTAASPVVGGKNGDIVYCSTGYAIGAGACRISKDGQAWTATEIWRTPKKNTNHWSTPVYYDGYIYGLFGQCRPTPENRGPLACVDIETGQVKWSAKDIGSQGGLILVGDKLLIQSPTGDILVAAASPAGFKELSRVPALKGGRCWNGPVLVTDLLFLRGNSFKEDPAEAACFKIAGD